RTSAIGPPPDDNGRCVDPRENSTARIDSKANLRPTLQNGKQPRK
ncbi:hypothetical protein CEXT_778841, partial [Caerostris extrusa]